MALVKKVTLLSPSLPRLIPDNAFWRIWNFTLSSPILRMSSDSFMLIWVVTDDWLFLTLSLKVYFPRAVLGGAFDIVTGFAVVSVPVAFTIAFFLFEFHYCTAIGACPGEHDRWW